MFKSLYTKLPILFLALVACLITVYGPVRAVTLAQTSESESGSEKLVEAKEFCEQKHESRRLRQKHVQYPVQNIQSLDRFRQLPVMSEFNPHPKSLTLASPPPLRAPPA